MKANEKKSGRIGRMIDGDGFMGACRDGKERCCSEQDGASLFHMHRLCLSSQSESIPFRRYFAFRFAG